MRKLLAVLTALTVAIAPFSALAQTNKKGHFKRPHVFALPVGPISGGGLPTGTAGSPNPASLTVQGVPNGTPVATQVFTPTSNLAALSAITSGATRSGLVAGTVIKGINLGSFPATCSFGASDSGAQEYAAQGGGFFIDGVAAGITQITCTGIGGTTTINLLVGSGLGAGSGGGGGGGSSSGSVTITNNSSQPVPTFPTNTTATQVSLTGVNSIIVSGQINAIASVPISTASAAASVLVAGVASTNIYVTSWDVIANGTTNVTFESATTGTSCATGTAPLTGAYPLVAQFGGTKGAGVGAILVLPTGKDLCILNSAAVQVSGSLSYNQF